MAATKTKKSSVPQAGDVLVLFGTVADTTWRLFLPTLGFTILGLWADSSFGSKPWLTIGGVTLGVVISLSLVALQMKGVKK